VQDGPVMMLIRKQDQTLDAYHVFPITKEPAGIRYPLYSSSAVRKCGIANPPFKFPATFPNVNIPMGPTFLHRRISLVSAATYGIAASSSKSGRRRPPVTVSISACAFRCASGFASIARTKMASADTLVSAPPVYIVPAVPFTVFSV
jgi:hypothetical protein